MTTERATVTHVADDDVTTSTHRLLGDPSRARILRLLEASPRPLSAAEVAAEVTLHPTTARFHLELLADAECVVRNTEVRTTPGRPRMLYSAAPVPVTGRPYQVLAELLAQRLAGPGGAASATTAGFGWGQKIQPATTTPMSAAEARERLSAVLAKAGFDPAPTAQGNLVLRQCPFIAVARHHPDIVCAVHLGLARGVLHQLGAPLSAANLHPSLHGPRCLLRLEPPCGDAARAPTQAGPGSSAAVPRSGPGSE